MTSQRDGTRHNASRDLARCLIGGLILAALIAFPGGQMEGTSQQSIRRRRPFLTFAVIIGIVVVGVLAIVAVEEAAPANVTNDPQSSMSEAAAALIAAVLAVVGSYLGHRRGRAREIETRDNRERVLLQRGKGVGFLGLSLLLVPAAFAFASWQNVSVAAATALAGAVIAITGADALHDMAPRLRTCPYCGLLIVGVTLVGGFVYILSDPENAEAVTAIGAAIITLGGSLLGHAEGFRR
jgi:hypothetical protein